MNRRKYINVLNKIAIPILERAANGRLKQDMPKLRSNSNDQYLEAIGRVICGIAPWIELNAETERKEISYLRSLIVRTLENITNQSSPDYIDFSQSQQSLVDSAYLCQGFLRGPSIWHNLNEPTRSRLILALKQTRVFRPANNNWLLFSSMVEAFFLNIGEEYDVKILWRGVDTFDSIFYLGDGIYSDGLLFKLDYYNSYVIHPMMIDILRCCEKNNLKQTSKYYSKAIGRFKRYVEIQERVVSPDGSYPVCGRTQICRLGGFQVLSQSVLLNLIPKCLDLSQIKGALDILLTRFISMESNFINDCYLSIGICGDQPSIAEEYVSYGSSYHCCNFFLCLGIPEDSDFWQNKSSLWTSAKVFNGIDIMPDKPLQDVDYTMIINKCFKLLFVYMPKHYLCRLKNKVKLIVKHI